MALYNRTRIGDRNLKRNVSVAAILFDIKDYNEDGDIAQLFMLPKRSYITNMYLVEELAFNPSTSMDLTFNVEGFEIVTITVGTPGVKNFTINEYLTSDSVSPLTVTVDITGSVPTSGKMLVMVEYVEVLSSTGEMNEYSSLTLEEPPS